jgi:integrase
MNSSGRVHLKVDEIEAILRVAQKDSKRNALAICLAFNHGLRVSELAGGRKESTKVVDGVEKYTPSLLPLQLSDIDFKNKQITIRRLKGSRETTQPFIYHRGKTWLSDEAALRTYLEERIEDGSGLLFTGQKGALSRWTLEVAFRKYREEASKEREAKGKPPIPDVSFHALKHSTGTHLSSQDGATVYKTAAWLGHANVQNAQIYWHPDQRSIGEFVQRSMVRAASGF